MAVRMQATTTRALRALARRAPRAREALAAAVPLGTLLLATLLLGALGACGGSGRSGFIAAEPQPPFEARFRVTNRAGFPVAGATVYLVPASDVDATPIGGTDVLDGSAEDRDEPLEDAVRLRGAGYPRGLTDSAGHATISGIPDGRYFWFVAPVDPEHLPGGSGCRTAREAISLTQATIEVSVSSSPTPAAVHVGTVACFQCHPAFVSIREHAHSVGIAVPEEPSPLQDFSRYPGFQAGWDRFLPAATHTGGTVVFFSDFDPLRDFDKFKTSLTDPTPLGQTVYVKAYLWRDTAAGDQFKITLENVHPMAGAPGPGDPPNPWTLEVPLTYGGALYKQRALVEVPGRTGLFPFLQFQTEGDDDRFDRTRRVYRDYHLDWFWDDAAKRLQLPPETANFEANCLACHTTGFERFPVGATFGTDGVDGTIGAYDLDGDGSKDEVNIGCEACHGPASDHIAWAMDPANAGQQARYIVSPEYLSPSREMMICGRCHGRELGNWDLLNEEPLDASRRRLAPGASRAEYLANHVTRKGPTASDYWSDFVHSKSNWQQYTDLMRSVKHRNDRVLVTCSDCHDSHGFAPYEHHVILDTQDPVMGLCSQCHMVDLFTHMRQQTSSLHLRQATLCIDCHMTETAKSGAGRYGILLGTPTGDATDEDITYFTNDIATHAFAPVPRKTHPDVAGEVPADAMPIPYTNICGGLCHNPAPLPFALQIPEDLLWSEAVAPGSITSPDQGDDSR